MNKVIAKKLFIGFMSLSTALLLSSEVSNASASLASRKPVSKSTVPATGDGSQLQKAAAAGDVNAENQLGLMYAKGSGVTKNIGKAADLYQKAADKGSALAQFRLGRLYENSELPRDLNRALELYEKSAAGGYSIAQFYLGYLYQNGNGVVQDLGKAAALYQKAANQDYSPAMLMLGSMYEQGAGVPKNLQKAAEFYKSAVEQGEPGAAELLTALKEAEARAAASPVVTTRPEKDSQDKSFEEIMRTAFADNGIYTEGADVVAQLSSASKEGSAESAAMLALLAKFGTWAPDLPKDDDSARQLADISLADGLAERAKEGRPNAQLLQALLYEYGLGETVDREKASTLAAQAAASGAAFNQFAELKTYFARPVAAATGGATGEAQIHPDLNDALVVANRACKLLMVDFYGGWCPWCVKMDETMGDASVRELMRAKFLYYKLDVGQFDQHTECIKQYQVSGIPHIVVFNSDGSVKSTFHGYTDAAGLKTFLRSVLPGAN